VNRYTERATPPKLKATAAISGNHLRRVLMSVSCSLHKFFVTLSQMNEDHLLSSPADEELIPKDVDWEEGLGLQTPGDGRPARPTAVLPITELLQPRKTAAWNIFKEAKMNRSTLMDAKPLGHPGGVAVHYKAGSAAPGVGKDGGFILYAAPRDVFPRDHCVLSYDVFFDARFQFNKGGKLGFGLFFGEPGASGGHHDKDTASFRVMWREGGAGEAYVYRPAGVKQDPAYSKLPGLVVNDTYGDSVFRGSFRFNPGTWNSLRLEAAVNTLDSKKKPVADGKLALTINGVTKSYDRMIWRTDPAVRISGICGASFFGGSNISWATPINTYVVHKDLKVSL
jgi:hypothetical protein